jgi:hypothetical protein
MVVQTRSMIRRINATKVAKAVSAPVTKNKKSVRSKQHFNTAYRNFVICGCKYKADVDRFYSKTEEFNNEPSVLKHFWKNTNVTIPEIPMEAYEKLLISLMKNETQWKKLDETVKRCVVPYEDFLRTPRVQTQINEGQTQFSFNENDGKEVIVDLSPLKEFSFWIQMMTKLLVAVQRDLLDKCDKTEAKIEKALFARHLFENNIACRQLITHKYAFTTLSFYGKQLLKLVEFFDLGLEFVLYAFGIFCPEMINKKFYPDIGRSNLYRLPELAVAEDDSIFGEAKKKFRDYY